MKSDKGVLEEVLKIVNMWSGRSDPSYETVVIMVAALFVGPDVDAIVRLTGSAREVVETIASRLRASGMWTDDGLVDYEDCEKWACGDPAGLPALALSLDVAEGVFIRTSEKTSNGKWGYELTEKWRKEPVIPDTVISN